MIPSQSLRFTVRILVKEIHEFDDAAQARYIKDIRKGLKLDESVIVQILSIRSGSVIVETALLYPNIKSEQIDEEFGRVESMLTRNMSSVLDPAYYGTPQVTFYPRNSNGSSAPTAPGTSTEMIIGLAIGVAGKST